MHSQRRHIGRKSLSLSRRGAWGQVVVAAILITVLPALILAWLWTSQFAGVAMPMGAFAAAATASLLFILLGYALLVKYPVSIVRLRRYLSTLAAGGIPDEVTLTEEEDDLAAVQRHMERIVKLAEDRVHMLERRHAVELESERQRVMVESMGAMCHHIGQPSTVLGMCLFRLKNQPTPEEIPEIIRDMDESFESLSRLLEEFRNLAAYASEPYLASAVARPGKTEDRIIKV
jgi:signal transduction histidine kinase